MRIGFVSTRFHGTDGVSLEASKWANVLEKELNTGRFGCSQCYTVFGFGLESLVKAMHKGTLHLGKVPSRYQSS